MCHFRVSFREIEQRLKIDFAAYFADCMGMLRQMQGDGLIQLSADGMEVLPVGRPLIARICMVFDAYQYAIDDKCYASIL